MSCQVRWKIRFIKNKTLDYEVRRNSGLVEARKRKYSAGNFTYASKRVVCVCVCVCVETYSRQAEDTVTFICLKGLKFKCSKLDYL